LYFVERRGNEADFYLFYEDLWLSDTAVIEHLVRMRGEWRVELVFAHTHNPLKFIKRYITSHPCPRRAAQQAYYMRRLAAKDQRGTLTVCVAQLALCPN
jgi:hypothetical protein